MRGTLDGEREVKQVSEAERKKRQRRRDRRERARSKGKDGEKNREYGRHGMGAKKKKLYRQE